MIRIVTLFRLPRFDADADPVQMYFDRQVDGQLVVLTQYDVMRSFYDDVARDAVPVVRKLIIRKYDVVETPSLHPATVLLQDSAITLYDPRHGDAAAAHAGDAGEEEGRYAFATVAAEIAFQHWRKIILQGAEDLTCKHAQHEEEVKEVKEDKEIKKIAKHVAESSDEASEDEDEDEEGLAAMFAALASKVKKGTAAGKPEAPAARVPAPPPAPPPEGEPPGPPAGGEPAAAADGPREARHDGYPRLWFNDLSGDYGRSWMRSSPSISNEYLDIRGFCGKCKKSRTRNAKPNPGGRSQQARSSGRVLGHVSAWVLYDCRGDAAGHANFPAYEQRRDGRIELRNRFGADPIFRVDFEQAERGFDPALDDVVGEPWELAKR